MSVRRGILVFLVVALFAVAVAAQIPGESWVRIGLLTGNVSAAGVSPSYDSDKTLFAGLQGSGLSVSTNNGRNWTHLSSIPNNATITGIAFYPSYEYGHGKPVFITTREGHVYESENDFTSIKYDYTVKDRSGAVKPATCVVFEPVHNYVYAGSQGGGVFRSINYGQTWTRVNSVDWDDCRALAVQRSTGKLLGAFVNSKYPPVAGYLGSGEWQWLGPSSLTGAVPTALHVAVDKDSVVFLGTLTHGLWVSQDVGGSWSAACDGSTQTQAFSVGAVAACPNFSNDHEVWEGRSDGLRLSFDAGTTCAPDFPYSSVQFIAFSPGYHRGGACDAFVGTNTGLYLRTCNPGPPPEPVTP